MNHLRTIVSSTISILLLFIHITVNGQENKADTLDYFSMSLEELMNVEVSVASSKALTTRESPGIVSLITSDEISRLGARDLIDVLRLIPGFEFGVDVQGVVGVGLRGNWGHEGKILILVDGQEMNERSFATTQLGHHFPLDQIERIEIIRGPGSAIYGGYAELGVINIITKKGKNLNGGMVSATYGQMSDVLGRAEANIMFGNQSDDLSYDVKFTYGQGNRSNRTYTDVYGDSYDMTDNSELNNTFITTGLNYKGLNVRMIYENYIVYQRDLFDAVMPEAVEMQFQGLYGEVKYDIKTSDRITVTPRIRFKSQNPWRSNNDIAVALDNTDFPGIFSDKTVTQTLGDVVVNADLSDKINLNGGVQYYVDKGESVAGYEYDFTGTTDIEFYNFSAFGQGLFKLDFANITVGARFNNHEQFGSAFVPRIGVTKVIDKFHTKLLFSQAFRAPSIQNIDPNPTIKSELTTVFEVEAGYKLSESVFLTANFFNIKIEDPIVYFYDAVTDTEGYENYEETQTTGIEAELKYKGEIGSIAVNYSFYTAGGNNKVASYTVPGEDNMLLGMPQGKFNLYGSIKLSDKIYISPSITGISEKYGYTANGLTKFDSEIFANLYLSVRDLLTPGLEVGVGGYNLTDNDYVFVQPYNSDHAPYPAPGREMILKVRYKFNW